MLIFLVFTILILNVCATIFLLVAVEQRVTQLTAHATTGTARLCLNRPPVIDVPCNATMSQGTLYTCQLNATEYDSQTLVYGTNASFFGINNSTGLISFTPNNDDTGNHSVLFWVDDGSGCDNALSTGSLEFFVNNINDPPELIKDIPDIRLTPNTTYHAFFLNDYFWDPDGDDLNYTVTIPSLDITIVIADDSSVTLSTSYCGDASATILFTASDPYNATADSNLVTITIPCPASSTPSTGGAGEGAGGGGGGGAAVLCKSEWDCGDWYPCLPTGFQWRHCYDLNGCEDPKFLKRECEYVGEQPTCEENWLCNPWGVCYPNGTQYRECFDLNECDTEYYRPYDEQPCEYLPTCFDGIKNGNETGIDCGGSCPACPIIEQPGFVSAKRFDFWMLIVLLLAVLLVGGFGRLYHEQLEKALARVAMLLSRAEQKEVLLTQPEKREILEKLLALEQLIDGGGVSATWDDSEKYARLTTIARTFLAYAADIPEDFSSSSLERGLRQKKVSQELFDLLLSFFSKIYSLEAAQIIYDESFFFATLEELRTLVCALAVYEVAEIERPLKTIEISENLSILDEILARLMRIYQALQFGQFGVAKQEYDLVLRAYEDLAREDQEPTYGEISNLFSILKYVFARSGA